MSEPATGPWQVRDFPTELREQVVKAARDHDQTVADFLAAIIIHARETGWSRAWAIEPKAANGPSNGLSNNQQDTEKIDLLVSALCRLAAQKGVPVTVRKQANAAIERNLLALQRSLPAPPEEVE